MRVACSDVFLLPALEPFGNEQACAGISRRKGKKKKRRSLFEGKADIHRGKVLRKNSIFSRVRTPLHGPSESRFHWRHSLSEKSNVSKCRKNIRKKGRRDFWRGAYRLRFFPTSRLGADYFLTPVFNIYQTKEEAP